MDAGVSLGIWVPYDVSIVGMYDIFVSALRRISLTTVRQPLEAMGAKNVIVVHDFVERNRYQRDEALRTRFASEPLLDYLVDEEELHSVMMMIGELNASHTGVSGGPADAERSPLVMPHSTRKLPLRSSNLQSNSFSMKFCNSSPSVRWPSPAPTA